MGPTSFSSISVSVTGNNDRAGHSSNTSSNESDSAVNALANNIINEANEASDSELPADLISEARVEFIKKTGLGNIRDAQYFGKELWKTHFGVDVGNEPPIPENLDEILNNPCPFSGDTDVKVKDTHMLVLIPKTVDKQDLTLNQLQNFIPNRQGQDGSDVWEPNAHSHTPVKQSYWILMTRDVIPGSKYKNYEDQKAMVNQHSGYVLPKALEVVVCILAEHASSETKLFGRGPLTYTRCAEIVRAKYPLLVGGFGSEGFDVFGGFSTRGVSGYGVAGLRRFEG